MPRKYKGEKYFPFKITVVPRKPFKTKKPWIGTNQWRRRAIHTARMLFWYQAKKALIKAEQSWYKFYVGDRYGAPGRLEFICPIYGLAVTTITQEEAVSFRKYWSDCAKTSSLVVEWLDRVDSNKYTKEIHSFLYTLLITKPPIMREVKNYQKLFPFKTVKPWQQTEGTSIRKG